MIHQLSAILQNPDAVQAAGLPDIVTQRIKNCFVSTFFVVDGASTIGDARMGARPGHPYADVVFCFAMARISQLLLFEQSAWQTAIWYVALSVLGCVVGAGLGVGLIRTLG